jgi:hypothetical protein
MTTARNHHYLPRVYLRGFAANPTAKRPQTRVFDLNEHRAFTTSIANIAVERDFNRIDIEGHKPDSLETGLSQFEGMVGETIRRITLTKAMSEDDRTIVLNLVALIFHRHPSKRAHLDKVLGEVWKDVARIAVETPERWAATVKDANTAGGKPLPAVSYEQMKAFVEEDDFDVHTNREYHIGLEFEAFDDLLHYFFERTWTLFRAAESTGGFVTSDNPVSLGWTKRPGGTPQFPPGLAHQETTLLFPLSREFCLLGEYGGSEQALEVDFQGVATLNANIVRRARRQVYAPHDKFLVSSGKGQLPRFGYQLVT